MNDLDFAALVPSLKLKCPSCEKTIILKSKNRIKFEMGHYEKMRCPYCNIESDFSDFAQKTVLSQIRPSTLGFDKIVVKGTTYKIIGERDSKKYPIVAQDIDEKILFFNRNYLISILEKKKKLLEGGKNE